MRRSASYRGFWRGTGEDTWSLEIGVDRGGQPETRKPAQGGLLGVFRRLSETGLDCYLVEPGGFEPPSASTPLSVLHA